MRQVFQNQLVKTSVDSVAGNKQADSIALLYYLNFSINGTTYHFNSPLDSISYVDNANASIYFQNEESTRFGWLNFRTHSPYYAGAVELFDPGAGAGLLLYEDSNSGYPVTITEYGDIGEFISGHYSGIYTDANDNPVYQFSCSFRVRRNK